MEHYSSAIQVSVERRCSGEEHSRLHIMMHDPLVSKFLSGAVTEPLKMGYIDIPNSDQEETLYVAHKQRRLQYHRPCYPAAN